MLFKWNRKLQFYCCAVNVKWGKEKYSNLDLSTDEPPQVFKLQLYSLTNVLPERQKIMLKGVTVKDDWGSLKLKTVSVDYCLLLVFSNFTLYSLLFTIIFLGYFFVINGHCRRTSFSSCWKNCFYWRHDWRPVNCCCMYILLLIVIAVLNGFRFFFRWTWLLEWRI